VGKSARRRVVEAAIVLAFAAAPASAADSAAAHAPVDRFERELAQLINDYRQRQGLPPLALADDLAELAALHSADMASRQRLSHDGFRDRFRQARSKICVENVGSNFRTPEGLFEGWRRSPDHHRNLLEPKVSRMAIVASSHYVTYFACL
jgi:uncharacterized protein YkwD